MVTAARAVQVSPSVRSYIIELANATRSHAYLELGMSPRASVALQRAARALAASEGRDFITPDDVKRLASPVLEHRLILRPEFEIEGLGIGEVIQTILQQIAVPR